jgi:hypothetical protein
MRTGGRGGPAQKCPRYQPSGLLCYSTWCVRARRERARKIAAILVADVVGADKDRTLSRLDVLCTNLIDPAIPAHHGRDAEYCRGALSRRSGCPWDPPPIGPILRQT